LPGGVGQAGLKDASQLVQHFAELVVVKPQSGQAIGDPVADEIDVATLEVAIEVGKQSRDERRERLTVVLGAHVRKLVQADGRGRRSQDVGAFDGGSDTALGHDREHPGVHESRHVAVERGRRDIGHLRSQFAGGQGPVAEERLDDPQADGVKEQISACHGEPPPLSFLRPLLHMRIKQRHLGRVLLIIGALVVEVVPLWRRGYGVGGNVIVRCRRGHLFTTLWLPGVSVTSLRLGWWRLQRCPVGGHWSLVTPVRRSDLTEDEIRTAAETRDLRLP
jgi:hypothetical protein